MVLQALRSAVFYALFLSQTAVLAILLALIAIIARRRTRFGWEVAKYWGASNLFLLRWIVGVRTRFEGREHMPAGPCIIAAKHQSDWDIFALLPFTTRPAFITKHQLIRIPFFGRAAMSIDAIEIDRSLGARAIPAMLESARAALARGCQIVIFPEGTRRAPLSEPSYRQGIVRMYADLGAPVVPVALNSGLCWGRNSLVIWPGTATIRLLPPIPPGLEPETFRTRLTATIEADSDALALEQVRKGLARPIPAAWRPRIAELERAAGVAATDTTY